MTEDPEEVGLRSPVIIRAPEPPTQDLAYVQRVMRRILFSGGFALVICLIILTVHHRFWDASSIPGRILYALHDEVFLPIKGGLFVASFPAASIILTMTLLLVAVGVLPGIFEAAPLKYLQYRVLNWALDRPQFHSWVMKSVIWTKRLLRRPPHLTRTILLYKWESEVIRLSAAPPGTFAQKEFTHLLAHTRFLGQLTQYYASSEDLLRHLEVLHFTQFFTLELATAANRAPLQDEFVSLWHDTGLPVSQRLEGKYPDYLDADPLTVLPRVFVPNAQADWSGVAHCVETQIATLLAYLTDPEKRPAWKVSDHRAVVILARISMNLSAQIALATDHYQQATTYWELIEMLQFSGDLTSSPGSASWLKTLGNLLVDNNAALQQMCVRSLLKAGATRKTQDLDIQKLMAELGMSAPFTFEQMLAEFWAPSSGDLPYIAQVSK